MALLPPFVRPQRALADFKTFWGTHRRHQLGFAALAVGATFVVLLGFWSSFTAEIEYKPPEVTYVEQWPASRTDAEVRARLAKDAPIEQAAKDAATAAAEKRRQEFKRLADKLGIQ